MDLGTLLPRHARYRAKHPAVVLDTRERITYAELCERVDRAAHALAGLDVFPGDRVATVLHNCIELLELYCACAALGAVVVPLSPLLNPAGLGRLLADARPRVVVADAASADNLNASVAFGASWDHALAVDRYRALTARASSLPFHRAPFRGDELFDICYSSGTTGLPKGITHSHDIRAHYGTHFAAAFRMTPESVVLQTGSIVFNGAFVTLMPCLHLGATYILASSFAPERFVELVERERATVAMLVPSQLHALLAAPSFDSARLRSLETVLSLGAPLPLSTKEELTRRLPGRFYELYGLTEGFVTILDRDDAARKLGSVGAPPPFFDVRICDERGLDLPTGEVGEIVGRGPILTDGYYGRPDLTRQAIRDGWLYTGDLGYLDADGFLHLVDRKKDLIISGGVNVYPADIEAVLQTHPAVQEAAVFGVGDEKWGESPVAAVVLKPGDRVAAEELLRWSNERVAARYQRLAKLQIVDTLPRNAAGKTLKRELREAWRS